jgi:type IV pilus assembly protein PilV
MNAVRRTHASRGFTLIELLITLVIVSVGLLGLAKLEAAAVSESGLSRVRSLMTYQAESLAALMRANRAYWGATTGTAPNVSLAVGSSTPADNAGTMTAATLTACTSVIGTPKTCTAAQIASADVTSWATNYSTQFPNGDAKVVCTIAANLPTTCDITLTWSEHAVAINRTSDKAAPPPKVAMILHVQP